MNCKEITPEDLKTRNVDDYSNYREGDVDPATGRCINILINAYDTHIIYLDEDYDIYWSITNNYFADGGEFSEQYGMIMNRVAELETLSESADLREIHLRSYRRLLGEAISRMLDDDEDEVIEDALQRAIQYLNERSKESAKIWYLKSAVWSVTIATLVMIGVSYVQFKLMVFQDLYYEITIASFLGAFGSLLSIVQRSSQLSVSPAAGKRIHYLEGGTRVVIGIVGAFFVALLMKANIISVNSSINSQIALIALCFAAGASERLVPALITQIENQTKVVLTSSTTDDANKNDSSKKNKGQLED